MSCKNCRYSRKRVVTYKDANKNARRTEARFCCRDSPAVGPDGIAVWPRVKDSDWCGKFKLRREQEVTW